MDSKDAIGDTTELEHGVLRLPSDHVTHNKKLYIQCFVYSARFHGTIRIDLLRSARGEIRLFIGRISAIRGHANSTEVF